MTGTTPTTTLDSLTLNITEDIQVRASVAATFDALLKEMGPSNLSPDGQPMPMVLEAKPGGRWFRDLGSDNGHFWGNVQAIKRGELLELVGPMWMSGAVMSNVQYRLKAVDGGTVIAFRHTAFGFIPDQMRDNTHRGWEALHSRVIARAEGNVH